jgi:hypothetical protein
MTRWAALRGMLLYALMVLMQCLAFPEMRTAWIVMAGAIGLTVLTAGAAILLSGRYRSN